MANPSRSQKARIAVMPLGYAHVDLPCGPMTAFQIREHNEDHWNRVY